MALQETFSSPKGSDFASQNKEENPLLTKGFGFCFAKQGGLYMKKYGKILGVVFLCGALLAGCGSTSTTMAVDMPQEVYEEAAYEDNAYDMDASYTMDSVESAAFSDAAMGNRMEVSADAGAMENTGSKEELPQEASDRKLIRTVNLTVETESFDALMDSIQNKVTELGGYVERMDQNNGSVYYKTNNYRSASVTARIPADQLDAFLDVMAENTNITYRSESVEDVTLQYVDVQSHLEALRAQQERLLELVEQAETVEELVYLEDQLTDVRYQIQSLESQMRTMNNQISYATVYIDVEEVTTYTPVTEKEKSAWERMQEGFLHNCRNLGRDAAEFFIGLVIRLPYILVWAVIILVAALITRKITKRRKAKKQERKQPDMTSSETAVQEETGKEA